MYIKGYYRGNGNIWVFASSLQMEKNTPRVSVWILSDKNRCQLTQIDIDAIYLLPRFTCPYVNSFPKRFDLRALSNILPFALLS